MVCLPANNFFTPCSLMNWKQLLLGTGILLLMAGCSTSNDVVSKSPIQKRKYRSGWHVNLNTGDRHNEAHVLERKERRKWGAEVPEGLGHQEYSVPEAGRPSLEPATAKVLRPTKLVVQERPASNLTASVDSALPDGRAILADRPARVGQAALVAPANDGETNERTNGMAIAGFVLSFFIPLLGIIFSAIALGQIRRRGGRGRGLATAGLIISLATILLVIALL
jgi:hypothetical protein